MIRFVPALIDGGPTPYIVESLLHEREIREVLISAYYLKERPDFYLAIAKKLKNSGKIILADSGGFTFLKRNITVTPERVFDLQKKMGADIIFTLDLPVTVKMNNGHVLERLKTTLENAKRSLELKRRYNYDAKLYAVVPAHNESQSADLARQYEELGVDGIAIGSLVPRALDLSGLSRIILAIRKAVQDMPLHVFGVAGFSTIYMLAKLGVESFDSMKYAHGARYREYHLPRGAMVYIGPRYTTLRKGLSKETYDLIPCSCPYCLKARTFGYYVQATAESAATMAMHNLLVMLNEVKLINIAIKAGWFDLLLKDRAKIYPSLAKATQSVGMIEQNKTFGEEITDRIHSGRS